MKTLSDMNEMLVAYLEATKDVKKRLLKLIVMLSTLIMSVYVPIHTWIHITLSIPPLKPLRCGTFCVFCIVPQPTSNHL